MDFVLNKKYERITFDDVIVNMFAEILSKDEVYWKVLLYIASATKKNKDTTIISLIENIKIERRVKVINQTSHSYIKKEAYLDRKTAEKIVDKLSDMSLLSYKHMTPYKLLFITVRGAQVLAKLDSLIRSQQSSLNNERKNKNG